MKLEDQVGDFERSSLILPSSGKRCFIQMPVPYTEDDIEYIVKKLSASLPFENKLLSPAQDGKDESV